MTSLRAFGKFLETSVAILLLVSVVACGKATDQLDSSGLSANQCQLADGEILNVGQSAIGPDGNEYQCQAGGRVMSTLIGH